MKKTILALLITAIFAITSFSVAFGGSTGADVKQPYFDDVARHWAADSINGLTEKGIMEAAKDRRFFPNKNITRSELVPIIHKALDIQIRYFKAPDIKEFFSDVKNEDSYASALYDLAITNIIDLPKGQFKPASTITREEMVHYIMNGYRYRLNVAVPQEETIKNPFADSNKIDSKYSQDISKAAQIGLVKGKVNNKFYPKDKVTRAEAAVLISRLLNILENKSDSVKVTPSFEKNENIFRMKLAVTNNTGSKVVINHSSGQKYDFALLDADKKVLYSWASDKSFLMALTFTEIEPGQSIEFTEDMDLKTYGDIVGKAKYLVAYITGKSDNFSITDRGYEISMDK